MTRTILLHYVKLKRRRHNISAAMEIVMRPTAGRAISSDIICQTIIQHCHTSDLELTATCCVKLRLFLYFQIHTRNSSVSAAFC